MTTDAAIILFGMVCLTCAGTIALVLWMLRSRPVPEPPARSQELEALVEINRLMLDVVGRMVAPSGGPGPVGEQPDPWRAIVQEAALDLLHDPSPDPADLPPLGMFDPIMNPHPGIQIEADE